MNSWLMLQIFFNPIFLLDPFGGLGELGSESKLWLEVGRLVMHYRSCAYFYVSNYLYNNQVVILEVEAGRNGAMYMLTNL